MTDEERERFLPVSRTFTSILEKDTLDVREMNLLLKQSRELTNELQKYGTENGFGDGSGTFGALGALAQGASTPLRRTSGGSSDNFNQFGVPTDGDQIVNVQGQGASFNTQFGKQKQTNKQTNIKINKLFSNINIFLNRQIPSWQKPHDS